jgi:hypothetical protein
MQPIAERIARCATEILGGRSPPEPRRLTALVYRLTNVCAVARSCSAAGKTMPFFLLALLSAALLRSAQPAVADFIQNGPKLVGTGAVGNAKQGISVALSADGNTALVGGPTDNGSAGAVWVFSRSNGVWTQQGDKLVANGAVGPAQQGYSVALSADGNTAIVGAPQNINGVGGAWVYTRSGGAWSQQGGALIGDSAVGNANQGYSVALSADGNTAIVGGPNDNTQVGVATSGAAWVFTRSNGVWTQQGNKLVGTGAVGFQPAQQGFSVALSADGNTAIVGGPEDNQSVGAAWVFTRSNGVWTQQGNKLVGAPVIGLQPQQGWSVALSGPGNTAIVGGPTDNTGVGAAWVFINRAFGWTQERKLIGTGAVGASEQGWSVALSVDGNTAIVGGPKDNGSVGAAWAFTRSNSGWTQQGSKLVGSIAGSPEQGWSVAVTCNTALVGAPFDNAAAGATWVFMARPTRVHDFNGDCLSDIVWYNTTNGQVVNWLLNGTTVIGGGSVGSAASPWAIVGQRDFNGDGKSDILWRNSSTGQLVVWLLNGSSVIGGGSLGSAASPWSVAGTGDFNGDGFGDVLWYNSSTGQVVIWLTNGTSVIGGGSPGSAATPWMIAGIGDFDGNQTSDILWYNTTSGQAVIWSLVGTTLVSGWSPGSAASPWMIGGTGDFNGDRTSDILWYNMTTGQTVIWLLDIASVIGGGSPGSVPSPWTIAQTGDFNGDGKSDILWYNPMTGQLVEWLLSGASVIDGGSPGSAANPWLIQGMNSD